jgi:hypothetical protein
MKHLMLFHALRRRMFLLANAVMRNGQSGRALNLRTEGSRIIQS